MINFFFIVFAAAAAVDGEVVDDNFTLEYNYKKNVFILKDNNLNKTFFSSFNNSRERSIKSLVEKKILTFDLKYTSDLEFVNLNLTSLPMMLYTTSNFYLKSLNLSNNLIDFVPNYHLYSQFITCLYLNKNKIQYIESLAFQNVSYLEVLDLSFNNLYNLDKETLNNLKYLRVLYIDHNKIFKISHNLLRFLTILEYLSITYSTNYSLDFLKRIQFQHNDNPQFSLNFVGFDDDYGNDDKKNSNYDKNFFFNFNILQINVTGVYKRVSFLFECCNEKYNVYKDIFNNNLSFRDELLGFYENNISNIIIKEQKKCFSFFLKEKQNFFLELYRKFYLIYTVSFLIFVILFGFCALKIMYRDEIIKKYRRTIKASSAVPEDIKLLYEMEIVKNNMKKNKINNINNDDDINNNDDDDDNNNNNACSSGVNIDEKKTKLPFNANDFWKYVKNELHKDKNYYYNT